MKALARFALVALVLYVTSYMVLRSRWTRTWDRDGRNYMLFPESPLWIYHLYRPLCHVDGRLSGLGFHIGPHQP